MKSLNIEEDKVQELNWQLLKKADKVTPNDYDAIIVPGHLPME